jgi:hypothetical protein
VTGRVRGPWASERSSGKPRSLVRSSRPARRLTARSTVVRLVEATWSAGWASMKVAVEAVPNQDRRPLVVIVGAEGTAVRRRGVLEVVGLAALAVEPAVAADSGGWGERASRGSAFRVRAFLRSSQSAAAPERHGVGRTSNDAIVQQHW